LKGFSESEGEEFVLLPFVDLGINSVLYLYCNHMLKILSKEVIVIEMDRRFIHSNGYCLINGYALNVPLAKISSLMNSLGWRKGDEAG
jgi:hypothetical protein